MSNPVAAVVKGDVLVVICEDGSVWYRRSLELGDEWKEAQAVPGTPASDK